MLILCYLRTCRFNDVDDNAPHQLDGTESVSPDAGASHRSARLRSRQDGQRPQQGSGVVGVERLRRHLPSHDGTATDQYQPIASHFDRRRHRRRHGVA